MQELYEDLRSNWKDLYLQCVDVLYGVIGTNKDTRDWSEIMNKQDVETAIQGSTREMHKLELKIKPYLIISKNALIKKPKWFLKKAIY